MGRGQSEDSQVPLEFLAQINTWRQRQDNSKFSFLFFPDHPARHIPWFIAFSVLTLNRNFDEFPGYDLWHKTLNYAQRKSRNSLDITVLNESDDLTPPSVQYIGDWSRTRKPLDGVVVFFDADSICHQIELLNIFPDGLVGASADFSSSGNRVNRDTKIRAVFNVGMSYGDVGRTWQSDQVFTAAKKEPERKPDYFSGTTIDGEVNRSTDTPFRKIGWDGSE
jgi:hypothetical protein